MTWSPQQEKAIAAVKEWIKKTHGSPQIYRLFGFAGTGKTTIAKELVQDVKGTVLFMCFTGKASLVLSKKGCPATTIHSAIYKAIQDEITGDVDFILNPDSGVANAKLVVVDEVSMVGEELARDLLSFGTKVLVLGDPAQLPPVKGEGFFINAAPDMMLTEIHRQAADNPIIRLSMDVREGRRLSPGEYGSSRVYARHELSREHMRELVTSADQVLCGLNKTRHAFNARVREIHGREGQLPSPGERIICLKNNKEAGLLNGSMWKVDRSKVIGSHFSIAASSLDEPDRSPVSVTVPEQFFRGAESELDWKQKRGLDEFTYAYAITVHKSQGSQFDNVLVYDESRSFREDAAKHLYTAITRAAERVTVVI